MNNEQYKLLFEQGIDVGNRTIYIDGDIDSDTSTRIKVGLKLMDGSDPIIIDINSFGGSAVDGFCIYEMLERYSLAPIVTINTGCAMSAGLLIFMAGDKRLSLDNAEFMYHGPKDYSEFYGADSKSLEIAAKDLKEMQNKMSALMEKHSNKKKAYWTSKSKSDFTFNKKTAVGMNIVTEE